MKPLLELVPDAKYPLRLVEADLCKPETWPNAVRRCTYVVHVASPVVFRASDDARMVRTAVQGTKNVLQACAEAGKVKRVVMTSSAVAISTGTRETPPIHQIMSIRKRIGPLRRFVQVMLKAS